MSTKYCMCCSYFLNIFHLIFTCLNSVAVVGVNGSSGNGVANAGSSQSGVQGGQLMFPQQQQQQPTLQTAPTAQVPGGVCYQALYSHPYATNAPAVVS